MTEDKTVYVDGNYMEPAMLVNGIECYLMLETNRYDLVKGIIKEAKEKGYEVTYDAPDKDYYVVFCEPSFWDVWEGDY